MYPTLPPKAGEVLLESTNVKKNTKSEHMETSAQIHLNVNATSFIAPSVRSTS